MRVVCLLAACLSACAAPASRGASVEFQDRLRAMLPEGSDDRVPVAFSLDGRRVAYVEGSAEGFRAVNGSWRSPWLDAL